MKRRMLITGFACLAVAGSAHAEVDAQSTFNIVLTTASYGGCSDFNDGEFLTCESLPGGAGDLSLPKFAWIVFGREGGFEPGDGIGAVQFGIEYDETVQVADWSLCTGGAQIPEDDFIGTWPESGTGNALTWAGGYYDPPGEVAKAGYFLVLPVSIGEMATIGDPRIEGRAEWVKSDVFGDLTVFEFCDGNLARIDLETGGGPICGDNCGIVPVSQKSWSSIKDLYRN